MAPKTLLYAADGETPVAVEVTDVDRMRMLLVEVFGRLIGYNQEGSEMRGPSPAPLPLSDTLRVIVDIVGTEQIEKRFAGLELRVTQRQAAAGPNAS